ncbi:hypothetical protein BDK88_1729 [Natrinema hispanicum]|uniref:Uncharacterized protein n=1 Tax=Natrinema hispanicum TaxID=392421 RepID=A0A482YCE6_9EURY|nr:hypothetical protein [Natrinema hispanicum]RZV10560.1 hypothetical protein BDK88_1729 [Natrinema hispanicum]
MRRRHLFVGTAGVLGGLAGCVDSALERRRTDRTGSSGGGPGSGSDEPITVGDPDAVPFPSAQPPHELALRNDGDTERTAAVEITADENESLLERDVTVSADETVTFVLVEPRSYTISITTSDPDGSSESSTTVGVDREPFDCTRSQTTVTLRENGTSTDSTSRSTSCPEPAVTDTSLERKAQDCASETDGTATVAFTDEAVVVTGRIPTPTPCYEPSLADVTYDDGRDVLTVVVDSGEQTADSCADCLGIVDYEATIDLDGRYPGRVAVRHETRGERRQVATATFPASE